MAGAAFGPPQPSTPSMNTIDRSPLASMSRTQVAEPDASGTVNSQSPGASGSVSVVPLHIGAPFSSVGPVMFTSETIMRLFEYLFASPFSSLGVSRIRTDSHTPPVDTVLTDSVARISGNSSLALPPLQAVSARAAIAAVPRAKPRCFRIINLSPSDRGANFRSIRAPAGPRRRLSVVRRVAEAACPIAPGQGPKLPQKRGLVRFRQKGDGHLFCTAEKVSVPF